MFLERRLYLYNIKAQFEDYIGSILVLLMFLFYDTTERNSIIFGTGDVGQTPDTFT